MPTLIISRNQLNQVVEPFHSVSASPPIGTKLTKKSGVGVSPSLTLPGKKIYSLYGFMR